MLFRIFDAFLFFNVGDPALQAGDFPDDLYVKHKQISSAPDAIAPDGSEVRILCQTERGSMAQFVLPPNTVSRPVARRIAAVTVPKEKRCGTAN